MDHLIINQELLERINSLLREKGINLSIEDISTGVHLIKDEILYRCVNGLVSQVEKILAVDPSLAEREILEIVAKSIVDYFSAQVASIRIYSPERGEMFSFGSYPRNVEVYEDTIPVENTIAGEVAKTGQTFLVPNIFKEDKYKNKEKAEKLGVHSMMAIPISLPRFSIRDIDTKGVLQIYYEEEDKVFTPLEVETAELLARRVSYVIARKRIKELQQFHLIKDKIMDHIFQKLAKGEGIKMRDLFESIIPELADIMEIQRCALFSVMKDRKQVVVEAGYPETGHGIGHSRSMDEPYINTLVYQVGPFGEFENEKVYPSYILIHNPKESRLLPSDIKHFLETQQIHSVLYIPLKVDEEVKYFLAFDAQAHHQRFRDEEIEILTFFGKELTKGLKLEKMGEILHDLKNPAIALAGFAKRIQKIVEEGDYPKDEKMVQALDIILKESYRLQELAFTLYGERKESIIDLNDVVKRRFLICQETIKELKMDNIQLIPQEPESPLWIRCVPLHVERVIDNLLSNACNAIPEEGGGVVSVHTYPKDLWAVVEIINTGEILDEEKNRYLKGETKGRGLRICSQLVKHMGGITLVESKECQTSFRVMLPLVEP